MSSQQNTSHPMFDMLFFGGTGDLAMRKLIPALYIAHNAETIHPKGRIWALSRKQMTSDQFKDDLKSAILPHLEGEPIKDDVWENFCQRIHYFPIDVSQPDDFTRLKEAIYNQDNVQEIIFYLAISPKLFEKTCHHLAEVGLNSEKTRVVLEKPLGLDLTSSNQINDAVANYYTEQQIYRIDHYLGKESVQNLFALRFANILFEPIWKNQWIDNVQITIAEQLGIEERGAFYDNIGALRDMVQNHLLQLLCTIAMEPPNSMEAEAIRSEKLKVLQSLRPFTKKTVETHTIRGQYYKGELNQHMVKSYLEESNISENSQTETFVAIKAYIDNWRWSGVPFYLRTGKRMKEKLAEIVVTFKEVPHHILPLSGSNSANQLVFRLQPDDSIKLHVQSKKVGNTMQVTPTFLNLDFEEMLQGRRTTAYERLLQDCIQSNLALFVHRKEQEAAWQWVEPIMDAWNNNQEPLHYYMAGTWGPKKSDDLIQNDNRMWHENERDKNTL